MTENDPTQKLIDRVNLAPNAFEMSDVKADLPAEHPDYVVSRLNADKAKANDFLNDASNIYTQKIRKAMSDLLKHQKLEEDISNKRAQYQSEHEKAVISATELESAKTHAGNLSELDQQVQILKQTNLNLEQLKR